MGSTRAKPPRTLSWTSAWSAIATPSSTFPQPTLAAGRRRAGLSIRMRIAPRRGLSARCDSTPWLRKGGYLVAAAQAEPDVLFIGIDMQPVCIAYASQRVIEAGIKNALLIPGSGEKLSHMFAPGELASITLNFPTPHPRKREAAQRLTTVEHLLDYRKLLAPGGTVVLRTDSEPL